MSMPDEIYVSKHFEKDNSGIWFSKKYQHPAMPKDKYISEAKHKQAIDKWRDAVDAMERKGQESVEQARKETRQQCADAMAKLFVSRMHLLDINTEFFITRADIDKAIRNSGLDKGEGE